MSKVVSFGVAVPKVDQHRPADWPKNGVLLDQIKLLNGKTLGEEKRNGSNGKPRKLNWVRVGAVSDFPVGGGSAVKYGESQIAVYNLSRSGEWYATQNMCPHMNAFVLSRGITGSVGDIPKVSCPLHKKPFSLRTGESLSGEPYSLKVFPVQVAGDGVYLLLPPEKQLDALLATSTHCVHTVNAPETCAVPA